MLKRTDLKTPVASHMRTDCTRFVIGQTVGEALQALRREPPGERIIYFYVVDSGGHLRGVVPTRRLLLSQPERHIEEVMIETVVSLRETATVQETCELFALHRFLALAVVDDERRLLGAVDIQLYTDELDQLNDAEARSNLFQALGVYSEGLDSSRSPLGAFRRRFPWLGSNLIGGLICAFIASAFQAELSRVVVLALFIPVVLNLAESVSSQSVSLTLHILQGQTPNRRFITTGLRQELATGLLLGGACGAVVGIVAFLWLGQARVALTLLGGISCGVAVSALLGLTLPVALRLLKLDPKVAAGPIALAGSDVTTLFVYLGAARWLLG
jgi:magnesium transporter